MFVHKENEFSTKFTLMGNSLISYIHFLGILSNPILQLYHTVDGRRKKQVRFKESNFRISKINPFKLTQFSALAIKKVIIPNNIRPNFFFSWFLMAMNFYDFFSFAFTLLFELIVNWCIDLIDFLFGICRSNHWITFLDKWFTKGNFDFFWQKFNIFW